jgi:hypothetical protein
MIPQMNEAEPSWKAAEKLVAAIERALAPDAIVEHNVHLPVLGQDRTRQCDVVLRIGKKPREQLFIIEVQQRGSKPDINTFGGWLRKMDEVGANGMICVSEAGFPDSILKDVAQRVGPKVRLITLDPNNEFFDGQPCYLVPELVRSTYKIRNIEITDIEFFDPAIRELFAQRNVLLSYERGKAFSHDGQNSSRFSTSAVAQQVVQTRDPFREVPDLKNGTIVQVNYACAIMDKAPLWLHADQGVFRLRAMTLRASVQRIDESEPMVYSKWSYAQEFHDGALAWIASSSFEIDEAMVKITLIFTCDEKGFLCPSLEIETKPR